VRRHDPARAHRERAPHQGRRNQGELIADPWFWALAIPAVALTGIGTGGRGGGAAVATPLMALTIPPAQAAAIMLPVLCLMDIAGVRAYLWRWDRRVMGIIAAP